MSNDEAVRVISAAMQQVREKVGYVQKTGVNQHFKYSYAGDADFLRAIRPAMVEAGLLMFPEHEIINVDDRTGNAYVRITYTLAHKDGSIWPFKIIAIGCGNDRTKDGRDGDKAIPKALTAAQKYALRHLFQIETGDDPEREDPPSEEPSKDVRDRCLQQIADTKSPADLQAWWRETQQMLPAFNIVNRVGHPGSVFYADIVDAVKKRLDKLREPPALETPETAPDDDIPL